MLHETPPLPISAAAHDGRNLGKHTDGVGRGLGGWPHITIIRDPSSGSQGKSD